MPNPVKLKTSILLMEIRKKNCLPFKHVNLAFEKKMFQTFQSYQASYKQNACVFKQVPQNSSASNSKRCQLALQPFSCSGELWYL
jgi:hypothetical protein